MCEAGARLQDGYGMPSKVENQPYICQMHSGKAVYDFFFSNVPVGSYEIRACEMDFVGSSALLDSGALIIMHTLR